MAGAQLEHIHLVRDARCGHRFRQLARFDPAKAIPLIIAAMRAIDPEGEWYSLGQVGQYITQANPDFDTRTYGSAKLSDLMRKISRFEVKSGPGGQLLARDVA